MTLREVKILLKKHQIRPSKKLGQNFLINKKILKKIIEAAELSKNDIVLEIGPGLGVLTQELAKKAKKIIAVEKDPRMIEILEELLKRRGIKNVKIIKGDILKIGSDNLFKILELKTGSSYKITANLPYYIVSPVIRKFLESGRRPEKMVLMVQKEVAQRICAKPPKMNLLAVSVQFYAKPKIISYVPKESFLPSPKVGSAIIKITPNPKENRSRTVLDRFKRLFFEIVRSGFSQPRKQLINNLSRGLKINKEKIENWLLKNNIQPTQRAETLTVEDWVLLTKKFRSR